MRHNLKLIDLFRFSLRTFKIKPARSFLTILGMSVGFATVLFLVSLGYGLQFILIGRLVTTEESLLSIEVFYPSETGLSISSADVKDILKIPKVQKVSPIGEFPGEVSFGDSTGLTITRIVNQDYFSLSGEKPGIGAPFLNGEPGVVISKSVLRLMGLVHDNASSTQAEDEALLKSFLGKELYFKIFFQNEPEITIDDIVTINRPLPVVGIVNDELQPPFALISASNVPREVTSFKKILVKAENADSVEIVRDALVEKGFLISARIDLVKQAVKVMNIITIVLGIFGITALVVAAVGMFNTMIVSFLERTYEIGILKSLGATDRDVKNLFLVESFVMGILGGLGGIFVGLASSRFLNLIINFLAERLGGKALKLFITPWWFMGLILLIAGMIGVIAGFWPARRAMKLSPKEAFTRR